MAKIYIIRHGNTFDTGDIVTRVGRKTDLPLSNSGKNQVKKLSKYFSNISYSKIYSSPLIRAKQTAEAISQNYEILDFLIEIDHGPDENKPEYEVLARIGSTAMRNWNEHGIPPIDWEVDTDKIKYDWKKLLDKYSQSESTILVVTSNGVARLLFDQIRSTETFNRKLKTGSFGLIEYSGETPIITAWSVVP